MFLFLLQKYELHEIFPHFQGLVFGSLHDFAFAGTLVVDAAQVQDAVDDDAEKFCFIRGFKLHGVGPYGIQADEQVARQPFPFTVVEGDDICIIIVLQVLSVHLQNLFVRAEYVGNFAHSFP